MEETKPVKSKFRLGQKVWYIGDGYVCNEVIKAIFANKWNEVLYVFETLKYEGGLHSVSYESTYAEDNIFATQADLIKSIKEAEYE